MNDINPYAAPDAEIAVARPFDPAIEHLARGQKTVIYAIFGYGAAPIAAAIRPELGIGLAIAALLAAGFGVFRIGLGLGCGAMTRGVLLFLMLVPLVNLAALLVLSRIATRRLRSAGRHVGLLGAGR